MRIIKCDIGWLDEKGNILAYNEKWAFLNMFRHPKFKTPIWKEKK